MGNKLYVGNLPYRTNQEELTELFSQYGEVTFVRIITDRESGRSRGFGFVTFENADDAKSAIEKMNDSELEGRRLNVNEARERKPRNI